MSAGTPTARRRPSQANGRLATRLVLAAETMFFIGLVFVALELRRQSTTWPPADAPALGLPLLYANTALLVVSSVTAFLARRSVRADRHDALRRWLGVTTLLGAAFLAGQLLEFQRLGGWAPAAGRYRTLFDTLSALHGLHVVAGLLLLGVVLTRARLGQFNAERHLAVFAAEMYWHLVTAAWLVLFAVLVVF